MIAASFFQKFDASTTKSLAEHVVSQAGWAVDIFSAKDLLETSLIRPEVVKTLFEHDRVGEGMGKVWVRV